MTDRDDLNWLAFRYVANELDPSETRALELQLEEDQEAREAVARAYALTSCIRAVESERSAPQRSDDQRTVVRARRRFSLREIAAVAAGLAACLLLALATLRLPRPEDSIQSAGASSTQLNDTDQLAAIWSETRAPLDDPLWPLDQLDGDNFEMPVAIADSSADEDWIATALQGLTTGENDE